MFDELLQESLEKFKEDFNTLWSNSVAPGSIVEKPVEIHAKKTYFKNSSKNQ